MKSKFLLFIGLTFALCACHHKADPLFGTWTVDKVNVQFDEQHSTPELVKQIGEMERQNVISITADSTLTFKGMEDSLQGRLSLKNDGTLLLDNADFGQWKDGQIITRTGSPVGEITVSYRKK
ncbi:MAG: hypothetical protein IKN08_05600 [Bacteroidales bacterium]|nr:hypothetical protein [Bacteroidales bacterium]MBR6227549.1 hypothetical protein [Bacteroidales bacterium]